MPTVIAADGPCAGAFFPGLPYVPTLLEIIDNSGPTLMFRGYQIAGRDPDGTHLATYARHLDHPVGGWQPRK